MSDSYVRLADFPRHWMAACNDGDLSGFSDRDDLINFFAATDGAEGFFQLSNDQRMMVADCRNDPSGAYTEMKLRKNGKEARAEQERARANQFNPSRKPAAADKPSATTTWDSVIERVNRERGL